MVLPNRSIFSITDQNAPRGKSYILGSDWFSSQEDRDQKTIILRNLKTSIENRYHRGFIKEEKPFRTFCSGSDYQGQWNDIDFDGYGVYHFPHGVTYEGYFRNGLFHGNGSITYTIGSVERVVMATFEDGKLLDNSVTSKVGAVVINPNNFDYCKMPDRRFEIEMNLNNLNPVNQENITNSEQMRSLEPATYDVGHGIFDAKRNITLQDNIDPSITKKSISIPTEKQEAWIRKSCRSAEDEPVGVCPKFFEYWMGGRKFELQKYGFLQKISEETNIESSITESQKITSDIITDVDIEFAQRGGITRILDSIDHAIDIKHVQGDMCGKDSSSDTEAKQSIFSIVDYLERQYSDWNQVQEEYQKSVDDDITGRDLTEDIRNYLQQIEAEPVEMETCNAVEELAPTTELSEILSDVDFSLEDMTITDDENEATDDKTLGSFLDKQESHEEGAAVDDIENEAVAEEETIYEETKYEIQEAEEVSEIEQN